MIYITGDRHGSFYDVEVFCRNNQTSKNDILIILGDAGINYYGGKKDIHLKEQLSKLPITLFCIHGNHENRPQNIDSYVTSDYYEGLVYYEPAYPNILFPVDGEIFKFNNYNCLVIGGAYSVDKYYRLERGYKWWEDEQPNNKIKELVELAADIMPIDIILSHTCPLKYEPTEMFLSMIDQSTVDKSIEEWLDTIEEKLDYKCWYCGHYHTDKQIDKIEFLYSTIKKFKEE